MGAAVARCSYFTQRSSNTPRAPLSHVGGDRARNTSFSSRART